MKKLLVTLLTAVMLLSFAFGIVAVSATEGDHSDEVISVLDHSPAEADWESAHAYTMAPLSSDTTGATGTVKLLVNGSNLYFRMEVQDATRQDADRPQYSITVGDKTSAARGKFVDVITGNPWLSDNATDFGTAVLTTSVYENETYTLTIGFNIGTLCVQGAHVKVSFSAADAQTSEQAWADSTSAYPHAIGYSGTLYIGQYSEIDPVGSPTPPTYSNEEKTIEVLTAEPTETDWDEAFAYEMTALDYAEGATGTVKLLASGTNLYFRMEVQDATRLMNDRPQFSIVVGGKTQAARGQYEGTDGLWLEANAKEFGEYTQVSMEYTGGAYVLTIGIDLDDKFVTGGHVAVEFTHADAQDADQGWADNYTSYPHALRFADTLYLGEYSETDPVPPEEPVEPDPEPTPGPENTDLEIVVTDLASRPKEADWEEATAYDLLPNTGNLTGATGTIKIYTAARNIYFRVEIDDPTTNIQEDGIYVYLGIEGCRIETRGNYNLWLNNTFSDGAHNDLGEPSLLEMSTTAESSEDWVTGKYTFDYGFYIPDIYEPGATIRLCFKHRDSRSAAEAWTDGDYAHTIYFDQTLTFGEEADTTIRPQEPTEGFTASVADISYNKASAAWNEYTGADTYRFYVYEVNEEGAEEPYTYISLEGPVYAGLASYSEVFQGLSATTEYAVQVVAYDADDNAIAYSNLAEFATISREEALNPDPGDDDEQTPPDDGEQTPPDDEQTPPSDEGTEPSEPEKGGCGSSVGIGGGVAVLAAAALAGAAVVLFKKGRKEQ